MDNSYAHVHFNTHKSVRLRTGLTKSKSPTYRASRTNRRTDATKPKSPVNCTLSKSTEEQVQNLQPIANPKPTEESSEYDLRIQFIEPNSKLKRFCQ
ncbi:unnamed protein product [Rhizophagus irregularis]|nr:unnamed protein product [Rhizophagus irregularis]CAB5213474.1 unnamed protein product [Rhizophagus irregularis]CAG8451713.1 22695_t:CDS:2 [Rhizophagus irregularis]